MFLAKSVFGKIVSNESLEIRRLDRPKCFCAFLENLMLKLMFEILVGSKVFLEIGSFLSHFLEPGNFRAKSFKETVSNEVGERS